jgi:hypothetical protein
MYGIREPICLVYGVVLILTLMVFILLHLPTELQRLSTRRTGRAGYQAIKEDKMGLTMQNWRLDRHVLLDWMDTAQLLRDQLPSSLFIMLTADDSASTGW